MVMLIILLLVRCSLCGVDMFLQVSISTLLAWVDTYGHPEPILTLSMLTVSTLPIVASFCLGLSNANTAILFVASFRLLKFWQLNDKGAFSTSVKIRLNL